MVEPSEEESGTIDHMQQEKQEAIVVEKAQELFGDLATIIEEES